MGFFLALLVSLAVTVVGELLRPKQKPQNTKASGLDEFSVPTADEGRSIPVFAGKVLIEGPNVTAYGDLEAMALTKKVKTGLFSSTRQTYAHKYFLGMQMALCWGREDLQIHEIRFGDAMPRHTRSVEGNGCTRFDFEDNDFFGGDEKEGGISGTLRFYHGTDSQTESAYLAGLVGEAVPAYKKLAHAVLEKLYLGTSPYIKPISFIVSSYPNQLGVAGGKHIIDEDANPACFIYEVITNAIWGVGLQPNDIDQVQFRAVAEKLHAEGYGMSVLYNGGGSARDIIGDILRHVDGVIFSDPQTGLISIRLARGGYDVSTLPHFGPDDFLEGVKFTRPSWSETTNVVRGTYVDRKADYTVSPVTQQDLANVSQRRGEISMEEIDFTGFSKYEPCALAVARALKTLSYPLAKVSGDLPRSAWKLKPADVVILSWPRLGIVDVPFRIVSVRYGGLRSNTVGIEAVEDIFAVSEIGYVQPPPSGWVDPLRPPEPMLVEQIVEMPYGMEPVEGSTVGTFGYRSNGIDEGYAVVSDRTSPFTSFEERGRVPTFTPFATLSAPYPATDVAVHAAGFPIMGLRGSPDREAQEFALIASGAGEEWVAYTGISGANVTNVVRGVFDTVPIDHPAGAVVLFASSGYGVENDGNAYASTTALRVKLLPYNARGLLAQADATTLALTTSRRGSRPLPPGRVRVNGTHPYLLGPVSGSLALAWASRNRLYPALLTQDDASVQGEDGTTYNVRAYRVDTNAMLASGSGNLTTASATLTYTGLVRFEIESQRDGLASRVAQAFVVDYTGAGASNVITVDSAEYILDGGGA